MTLAQLILRLNNIAQHLNATEVNVMLSKDEEGNDFKPLYAIDVEVQDGLIAVVLYP